MFRRSYILLYFPLQLDSFYFFWKLLEYYIFLNRKSACVSFISLGLYVGECVCLLVNHVRTNWWCFTFSKLRIASYYWFKSVGNWDSLERNTVWSDAFDKIEHLEPASVVQTIRFPFEVILKIGLQKQLVLLITLWLCVHSIVSPIPSVYWCKFFREYIF